MNLNLPEYSEKLQQGYVKHKACLKALINNKQTQFLSDDKPIKK